MSLPFRVKIILGIASIQTVVLLILAWNILTFLEASHQQEFDRRAYTTVNLFASLCKEAMIARDAAGLAVFAGELLKSPGVVYARVRDSEPADHGPGYSLAEAGDAALLRRHFSPDHYVAAVDDGVFDVYSEVRDTGLPLGRVEVGFSVAPLRHAVVEARQRIILLGLLEIGLVGLFSYALGVYLTRHLRRLQQAASAISQGGAGVQIDAAGDDELARAAQSFNLMSRRLQQSYTQLNQALDESRQVGLQLQRELTERCKAEAQLRKLSRAVEQSASAVVITDLETRIEFVNPAFTRLTGYSAAEAIGQTPRLLKSGKTPPQVYRELWDCLRQGDTWQGEVLNRNKNGDVYWELLSIAPLKDAAGQTTHYVGVKENISQRKQAEEAVLATRRAAEHASRSKTNFIANISHEIRTPLNAIMGFTDILSKQVSDRQQREYLNSVRASANALLALFNDILDLSRMEMGELELHYKRMALKVVLKEVAQSLLAKMNQKGLEFIINIDPDLPDEVLFDETRLRQVLLNLLRNALKFTRSGYVSFSAETLNQDGDQFDLGVSIQDTGIGIAPERQQVIFEAFEQGQEHHHTEYGGTGLGLSITKRLLEKMGGDIRINSKPGQGSQFSVNLPRIQIAEPSQPDQPGRSFDPDRIKFYGARVLFVDDVKLNRVLARSYLSHAELTLVEAENGEQALEIAHREYPDLILMDLKMPVMDGFTAIRLLKQDPALRSVPVLVITATPLQKIDKSASRLCDGLLQKPFSKEALILELMHFLDYHVHSGPATDADSQAEAPVESAADARSRLPQLLAHIERHLQPRWQTLGRSSPINEIENFGREVKLAGVEYANPTLREWGETLQSQAELFDIQVLFQTLEGFPRMVRSIGNGNQAPPA